MKNIPEIIVSVNSPESISAAVQNGADAVCADISDVMGSGLSTAEFASASEFCRVRGVEIYANLDCALSSSNIEIAISSAQQAWLGGADAIIAGDIGLIYALRRAIPDAPVFAGLTLNIHDLEGLRLAAAMGVKRVILSPQLGHNDIKILLENSPVEIEIFAHGFSCISHGGQCILSGKISGRCDYPCKKEYISGSKNDHPLSSKDICLSSHLCELRDMGASRLRLNGVDRRPEYTALLTGLYVRAVSGGSDITNDELSLLSSISPVSGLTDGYYTSNPSHMSGTSGSTVSDDASLLSTIRKGYLRREFQRVPVTFTGSVSLGNPMSLTATDDRGNTASGEGGKPELAFHREFTQAMLQTELFKTGGTPFYCENARLQVSKGLTMAQKDAAALRDKLLNELLEKRKALSPREIGSFTPETPVKGPSELPILTVSVLKASSLSRRLAELAPPILYIPLEEIRGSEYRIEPFLSAEGVSVCAVLPRIIFESEKKHITELLLHARQLGINEVLCSCPGHIFFARSLGFEVRGGLGMAPANSTALNAMSSFGLKSVTLSPLLSASEVSAISKAVDTEYIVYGRLPLMLTENCVLKDITGTCSCESYTGLMDRDGLKMPVMRTYECRNTVYSSKKLSLHERSSEYLNAGLWGVQLMFTTENADECVSVTEHYLGLGGSSPASYTLGSF